MQINMLKSKIHRATVVQSELDYVGSITVDEDLMDASGIYEYTGSSLRSITFTVNGVSVCQGIRSRFETGISRIIIIMEFLVSKRSNAACRKHQTR